MLNPLIGWNVAHAEVLDELIIIQTQWNEKELVKQIPGASWSGDLRMWTLPLSWAACMQLRGVFRDTLTIGGSLNDWALLERKSRVDPALRLRDLTAPEVPWPDDRLRDFQRAGVDWLKVAGSSLLGDDTGTGKTIQMLELLRLLEENAEELLPAVVICPNGTKLNWAAEAEIWCPRATPYVIKGGAVVRKKLFTAAAHDSTALVIINIEAVRGHSRLAPYGSIRLKRCPDCGGRDPAVRAAQCEVHPRELNLIPFKTAIVDEAHRIKDPRAKQTRACWAVGQNPSITRRHGTTGTAIADGPDDLWSIMHFIVPDEHPVRSTFVDRYCLLSWGAYGGMNVTGLRPDTRDEFYRIIDPRFRRMSKELVLTQLPPRTRSRRYAELSPRQAKAYRDIETGLATRLPDGSIMVAPNDLVAQTRLIQFSSATMEQHFVPIDVDKVLREHNALITEGKATRFNLVELSYIKETGFDPHLRFKMCDPSTKVDVLMELIEELGSKPICVAAEHRQLINLAAARLTKHKIPFGLITGGQKDYERHAALQEFQKVRENKLHLMLFTIKAGGEGLTMTAADTMIFLQRSWSMIGNIQSEGRIARIGSEKHTSLHYIDVIAPDTVEEQQIAKLWEKSERLEEINRDRARLAAAGLYTTELQLKLDDEEKQITSANLGDLG